MTSARIPHAVAVVVVLLLAVPAVFVLTPASRSEHLLTALVRAPVADVAALAPGIEVLERYESFVLVRMTRAQLARVTAHGIAVDTQDDADWIGLAPVQFHVRDGEPAIPPLLRSRDGDPHYLVHFIGPVKAEWIAHLRSLGADVLHSIPTYAFLVAMDATTRDIVRSLRYVDWVGAYHPAYRIHPSLSSGIDLETVQILTFETTDTASVLRALRDRGIAMPPESSTAPGVLSVFFAGDLGVIRARLPAHDIALIATLEGVMYVERWKAPHLSNANAQALLQTGLPPSDANARRLWDVGIRGQDQVVGIADTGLDFDVNFFRESAGTVQSGDVYNVTDQGRRKLVRYFPMSLQQGIDPWTGGDPEAAKDSVNGGGCPSGHGTSVAGNVAGWDGGIGTNGNDGMAPDAKLVLEDIGTVGPNEDCPTGGDILAYIPDNYDDLFGPAYDAGARIHTNSWGADTNEYDLQAMMVDRFIWNHPDMTILFAAGNSGPNAATVQAPGTAKSAVTVAGANPLPSEESLAAASSRGPSADGRRKPDITTFFAGTTASSSGNPFDNLSTGATRLFSGTSHATPLAAGMAALVRQYFAKGWYPAGTPIAANGFDPSAALVKAVLLAGARRMTDASANVGNTYPNNAQGWGRIALDDALYLNPGTPDLRTLWVIDERQGLLTGQSADHRIRVDSNATPLRIVLVWSDYPGLPNTVPATVNDLNLLVTDPSLNTYKGNVFRTFSEAESSPNSGSYDVRNTVEGVIVNAPAAGEWRIRIEGTNVPSGPQPFAIVAVADLDLGYGDVVLDKRVYRAGETVRVEVRDENAASVSVNVRSSTDGAGEVVSLVETAANSGVWRIRVPIALGAPVPGDGILQVSEGDTILARYSDGAPAHVAVTRATVDLSPPVIMSVHARELGDTEATITWMTNKANYSTVFYGTSLGSLSSSLTVADRTTSPAVRLTGLLEDTIYYYDVETVDAQGLATRDDNGGAHYAFRTKAQGDVLLVIGENSFPADRVAMSRDALEGSGWLFDEWNVPARGDPSLATLRSYKAVVWQPGLEQYPPLTDAQRTLLKDYLDGGGRLFISSHDIAWAFCSPFGNPYYTAARCSWFQTVLKSRWQEDPPRWSTNTGIAGDPISGTYTAGVSYMGHRQGGHGDEVDNLCGTTGDTASCVAAGATTQYVWKDNDVNGIDHVGIRWEATGTNGTSGVGAWGGTPSRVVAFFFEWTGFTFTSRPSSPTRTDILNRTLVWLLGDRDHPAVDLRSATGGETFSTNTVTINWTRTAAAGVASQALYVSNNSGERWDLLDFVPAGTTSYAWDVSALPNGGRYRVRIAVTDGGTPALTGFDTSATDFSIQRAGGDAQGPLIRPGSIAISPNPIVAGRTVTIRAIAEEGNRGNSTIVAAELFRGPSPGADGTGMAGGAADGAFDGATEALVWAPTATWPTGPDCLWIHARDANGNWGPSTSRCTETIPATGLDTVPPAAAAFAGVDLAGGLSDVAITWQPASDGGDVGGTYLYRVLRSTSTGGPYSPVGGDVLEDGAVTYTFFDVGAGDPSPSPALFYIVQSIDLAGNVANGTSRAAKVSFDLPSGVSFVSVPFVLTDPSPSGAFRTASPRSAWAYDGCAGSWRSYSPNRAAGDNSLREITPAMGLFVDLLAPDRLTFVGVVQGTTEIPLCSGWNFVGFPSFATITVADALAATGGDGILGFDPAAVPGRTKVLALTDVLEAGRAYWIHTSTGTTWTVPSG